MSAIAQKILDAANKEDYDEAAPLIEGCIDSADLKEAYGLVAAITPPTAASKAILAAIDARILALPADTNNGKGKQPTAEKPDPAESPDTAKYPPAEAIQANVAAVDDLPGCDKDGGHKPLTTDQLNLADTHKKDIARQPAEGKDLSKKMSRIAELRQKNNPGAMPAKTPKLK